MSELYFTVGASRHMLKEFLTLEPQYTETMLIKTFGSESGNKQLCDVVSLRMILSGGGSIELPFSLFH